MRFSCIRNCFVSIALLLIFAVSTHAQTFPPSLGTPYRNSVISFDRSPSLATDPTQSFTGFYMAYGSNWSDDYIYISTSYDGVNWTNAHFGTLERGYSPTISFYGGKLWVAFVSDGKNGLTKGVLYLAGISDPASGVWSTPPHPVTWSGTGYSLIYPTNSPTLAVVNNQLWVTAITRNSSTSVLYSDFEYSTTDGITFNDAPGCINIDQAESLESDASVAMIEWNSKVYFAYQTDSSTNHALHVCTTNPTYPWNRTYATPSVNASGSGVSAVVYGNYLAFAYKNLNSNNQVIAGTNDGVTFEQEEYASSMNGSNQISPSIAVFNNQFYMLSTAPATDHHMWTSHN